MSILSQLMFNDSIFNNFIPSYGTSNSWDISKKETGYELTLNVPGFSKSDIEIEIEGDTLHIQGTKGTEDSKRVVNKRFNLETLEIDYDQITAKCEDGVLSINLPLIEEMQPTKKSIKIS